MGTVSSEYVCFNGSFYPKSECPVDTSNRAFRYGDAIFETIRYSSDKPLFIEDHFKRLKWSLGLLQMELPPEFGIHLISIVIKELVAKNGIVGDANVRLQVFRSGKGKYTPEINSADYFIEVESLESTGYSYNEKGIRLGVYNEVRKQINKFNALKSANSLLYVMAGLYNKEVGFGDCLILNEKGNICEAISSNIFVYRDQQLFTPSVQEGCVVGIMRKQVIRIATESGYKVSERALSVADLTTADEVFLTNSIGGVIWVGAFDQKRYFNSLSKLISIKLNQFITSDRELV